ncbi:MAG: AMP-binding protein [Fibrobacter sp.]|nr:AMP-binding protein [Fibrobacter sp.]
MNRIGYVPGSDIRNNVTEFLRDLVNRDPHRVLLSRMNPETRRHDHMDAVTLWTLIRKTAQGFENSGIRKGDRILVFLPMTPPLYIAMFALEHLGAVPVFLDGWARRDELGVSAEIALPKGVISFPQAFALMEQTEVLRELPVRIVYGGDVPGAVRLESLMQTPEERETEPVAQEDSALITFTTGSSGRPKGADRTHRFLAAQHYALSHHLVYTPDDADLPVFPIFSLNNIASGVRTVLPAINLAQPAATDAATLLEQFRTESVTCATLSPWLFREMGAYCERRGITLDNIRRLVTGGAPVSRDELRTMQKVAPNAEILVLYGSTEVEPIAHISARELLSFPSRAESDPEWVDAGVNVGRLDPGLQAKFLKIGEIPASLSKDEEWEPLEVQTGEVGELVVSGEHVCRSYFRDPEAVRRAKIIDGQGNVWHRTGDLGYLDKAGNLWLVGRVHNVIRHISGYRYPVRAEMVLRKLPFVEKAAFLGMPQDRDYEACWCVLQTKSGAPDEETCRSEVRRILSKNGILYDHIVFVPEIPMDARHHSKVQYHELRETLLRQGKSHAD